MKPHYQVVAAVITHEGKILCMQRPKGKYEYTSYHWEFPGGKIEQGETPQEALHRELLEEMDYDVEVGDYLCTVEYEYPDFIITMQAYWCKASTFAFNRKEHVYHKWLLPEKLSSLDWCAADRPIMHAVLGYDVGDHYRLDIKFKNISQFYEYAAAIYYANSSYWYPIPKDLSDKYKKFFILGKQGTKEELSEAAPDVNADINNELRLSLIQCGIESWLRRPTNDYEKPLTQMMVEDFENGLFVPKKNIRKSVYMKKTREEAVEAMYKNGSPVQQWFYWETTVHIPTLGGMSQIADYAKARYNLNIPQNVLEAAPDYTFKVY